MAKWEHKVKTCHARGEMVPKKQKTNKKKYNGFDCPHNQLTERNSWENRAKSIPKKEGKRKFLINVANKERARHILGATTQFLCACYGMRAHFDRLQYIRYSTSRQYYTPTIPLCFPFFPFLFISILFRSFFIWFLRILFWSPCVSCCETWLHFTCSFVALRILSLRPIYVALLQ